MSHNPFPNGRHWADGHRIYDGCPDSTLQAKIDANRKERERLNALGGRVTYYPMEEIYIGFIGLQIVTPDCRSREEAYRLTFAAIEERITEVSKS